MMFTLFVVTGVITLLTIILFSLYACLVVAKEADERIEKEFKNKY